MLERSITLCRKQSSQHQQGNVTGNGPTIFHNSLDVQNFPKSEYYIRNVYTCIYISIQIYIVYSFYV